jgi:two-component system sensor histidine kinase/response regulator
MKPDLILLDIMMPVMDGLEVCRRLKKDQKVADIPVIFLTAKNQTEDLEAAFSAGGVDYITKPFKREELLIRIKNHLELSSARRKIIEMNKSRDMLYSVIAHDVRSPLSSISMSIKSIADGYLVPGTPEFREIMDYLNTTSATALAMIGNLLTYTRSQDYPVSVAKKMNNICPLIEDCINLLKGSADLKGIEISSNNNGDVPAYFDEITMHAVLRNLIMNAVKFTPEKGKIQISAAIENDRACIVVSDNGVGMTDEIINKVFNNNEHFTSPGTRMEKGSGLGAYIIRDFVKKNNGQLEVTSTPGAGTSVKVYLPVSEQIIDN